MTKHPRIIVDKNFSFNVGPETVLVSYKVSDDEALHSIEIAIRDLEAFKTTVEAIEKEIYSTNRNGQGTRNSLASGYIRERPQRGPQRLDEA